MNNTESRTTFIFNLTWAEQLAELDDATRLRFMDAIIAYAKDGTMPKMSALEKALFIGIQTDIDANNARFEEMKHRRSEAGKKSAAKRATQQSKHCSTETSIVQQSKHCSTVFNNADSVQQDTTLLNNVNSNEYENEYEIKENDYVVKEKTDDADIIDQEIAVLKTQDIWLDTLQALHHIDKNNLIRYLDLFALQCRADGKTRHNNHGDLKGHFNNWLRIKIQEDARQQQNTRRGRNNLTTAIKNYDSTF